MSKNETNRVQIFLGRKSKENKRFKAANNKNTKKYKDRVELEAELIKEFLAKKENG